MIHLTRRTILATVLGLLALAGVAGADEEKIALKDLPRAVLKAIKSRFPKAEIEEASKEEEDGRTTYEVELEIDDRAVDVTLKSDGTILEIEREVPVSKLPKAVRKAIAAKYPKAEIAKVEAITRGEKGPVRYEVTVTTELLLDARGKFVGDDEEDEEDEKPSAKGKKGKGKEEDEDDEDDDEKKSSARGKKGEGEKGESMEEDEDDDKKPSAKGKKGKGKEEKEDEDDDDEDEKKSSAKGKKGESKDDEDDKD